MSDSKVIDQVGMERILYAIEESLKVCAGTHFYGWAQGALHGLLPHDILLCVYGDLPSYRVKYSSFSCLAEERQIIDRLTDPAIGLLSRIIETWLKSERKPLVFASGPGGAQTDRIGSELQRLGCGNAVAHGAREISGSDGSFFIFMRIPDAPKLRQVYLLDLLMPHLHMALYRMVLRDGNATRPAATTLSVLSARQIEVLNLVGRGKTNQEIGLLLNISTLTVKNHVQTILRKLGVSNRAEAVANAQMAHPVGDRQNVRTRASPARKARAPVTQHDDSD